MRRAPAGKSRVSIVFGNVIFVEISCYIVNKRKKRENEFNYHAIESEGKGWKKLSDWSTLQSQIYVNERN